MWKTSHLWIEQKCRHWKQIRRNEHGEHRFYLVHHESLFPINIHFKITANLHYPKKKQKPQNPLQIKSFFELVSEKKKLIKKIWKIVNYIKLITQRRQRGKEAKWEEKGGVRGTQGHILRRGRRQIQGDESLGFCKIGSSQLVHKKCGSQKGHTKTTPFRVWDATRRIKTDMLHIIYHYEAQSERDRKRYISCCVRVWPLKLNLTFPDELEK